jgi:phenylacetic acid degradation operon negative regulatory protein
MVASTAAAPAFRRRREVGAASARSLLLTVLGEFVLPHDEPVWTSAFLDALGVVGVEDAAARQALARTAAEGWLAAQRAGRRTAWQLTAAGRDLLTEGAHRIYSHSVRAAEWDGTWLVVIATATGPDRRRGHLLRSRLAWSGLGTVAPGVWVSTHPERQGEVRRVLESVDAAEGALLYVGTLGDLGEPRDIARRAWALDEIEQRYEEFVTAVRPMAPRRDEDVLGAQIRLVQEWRRFPFLDPGLPDELLPQRWTGWQAAELFRARHARWKPAADGTWRRLTQPS